MQSVLSVCLICWGGNATKSDSKKVDGIIKKAGRISQNDFPKFKELLFDLSHKENKTKQKNPDPFKKPFPPPVSNDFVFFPKIW